MSNTCTGRIGWPQCWPLAAISPGPKRQETLPWQTAAAPLLLPDGGRRNVARHSELKGRE